jgi:hypothetical protein
VIRIKWRDGDSGREKQDSMSKCRVTNVRIRNAYEDCFGSTLKSHDSLFAGRDLESGDHEVESGPTGPRKSVSIHGDGMDGKLDFRGENYQWMCARLWQSCRRAIVAAGYNKLMLSNLWGLSKRSRILGKSVWGRSKTRQLGKCGRKKRL